MPRPGRSHVLELRPNLCSQCFVLESEGGRIAHRFHETRILGLDGRVVHEDAEQFAVVFDPGDGARLAGGWQREG